MKKTFLGLFLTVAGLLNGQNNQLIPFTTTDLSGYSYLKPQFNSLQFNSPQAIAGLLQSWQDSDKDKFTVVLIGDGQLQTMEYPDQLSRSLHKIHGDGGLGWFFPNKTVGGENAPICWVAQGGTWTGKKSNSSRKPIPAGIAAGYCRTESPQSFLKFNLNSADLSSYNRLQIFCKQSPSSFDIRLKINGKYYEVPIGEAQNWENVLNVPIPPIEDGEILLELVKGYAHETEFELYGLNLDNSANTGAILHHGGAPGLQFKHLLYQSLLSQELRAVAADVVLLDLGLFEYIEQDRMQEKLPDEIRAAIDKIRSVVPEATVVLISPQDYQYKGASLVTAEPFADLLRAIAFEKGCAFYDWHQVAGGQESVQKWAMDRLCSRDMQKLTTAGYQLKGRLVADALRFTVEYISENPQITSIDLDKQPIKNASRSSQNPQTAPFALSSSNDDSPANLLDRVQELRPDARINSGKTVKINLIDQAKDETDNGNSPSNFLDRARGQQPEPSPAREVDEQPLPSSYPSRSEDRDEQPSNFIDRNNEDLDAPAPTNYIDLHRKKP